MRRPSLALSNVSGRPGQHEPLHRSASLQGLLEPRDGAAFRGLSPPLVGALGTVSASSVSFSSAASCWNTPPMKSPSVGSGTLGASELLLDANRFLSRCTGMNPSLSRQLMTTRLGTAARLFAAPLSGHFDDVCPGFSQRKHSLSAAPFRG